jgi:replicative DNA helicase
MPRNSEVVPTVSHRCPVDSQGIHQFPRVFSVPHLDVQYYRGSSDRRQRELSAVSQIFKALAEALNVPIIALSQLDRKVEDSSDMRSQLAYLRESGAIE